MHCKYKTGQELILHGGPTIKIIPTESTLYRRAVEESYVHGQDPPLTAGGDRKGSAFSDLHS